MKLCSLAFFMAAGFCLMSWDARAQMSSEEPPVSISEAVTPRMQPSEVMQVALNQLSKPVQSVEVDAQSGQIRAQPPPPRVLSLVCIKGEDLPTQIGQGVQLPYETIWVVRAEGKFIKTHPSGKSIVADSGFLVIDDATGQVVGRGTP